MAETIPKKPPAVVDNSQPFWADFCPPDGTAAADWFRAIVPAGAPVVAVGPYVLPCVVPHVLPVPTGAPPLLERRDPTGPKRHALMDGWRLEVAIARDLFGTSSLDVARSFDFRDCDHTVHDSRSRNADRYLRRGRLGLHELDAWPWSIEAVLPRGWRSSERFLRPLAEWHRLFWTSAYIDLQTSAAAARGERPDWLGVRAEADARYWEARRPEETLPHSLPPGPAEPTR